MFMAASEASGGIQFHASSMCGVPNTVQNKKVSASPLSTCAHCANDNNALLFGCHRLYSTSSAAYCRLDLTSFPLRPSAGMVHYKWRTPNCCSCKPTFLSAPIGALSPRCAWTSSLIGTSFQSTSSRIHLQSHQASLASHLFLWLFGCPRCGSGACGSLRRSQLA